MGTRRQVGDYIKAITSQMMALQEQIERALPGAFAAAGLGDDDLVNPVQLAYPRPPIDTDDPMPTPELFVGIEFAGLSDEMRAKYAVAGDALATALGLEVVHFENGERIED